MHKSSYDHVARRVRSYLEKKPKVDVVDIGAMDVNGSYRPLFEREGWRYRGLDLSTGPNVDIVLSHPYRLPLASNSVDVVISGQAFEHIEFFWLTWLGMVRVTKADGLIFLVVPSRGPEHRYPVDCWRFYKDGMEALAHYGELVLLEATTDWEPHPEPDSALWGDSVGVYFKPQCSFLGKLRSNIRYRFAQVWQTTSLSL